MSHLRVSVIAAYALLTCLAVVSSSVSAQVNVWTQHNNNARTGANLSEVQLNTSNVNAVQFGKLFQYSVDGPVFAQPLVISNLSIPGKGVRNVVFVATMNNSVYAFDADDPTRDSYQPIWQVSFNNPAAGITTIPSAEISPSRAYSGPYGIMGTPVIDQATRTMYLVVRTKENGAYVQRLRAMDITTGQERAASGVAITAAVGATTFSPKLQSQRAALALANGRVYIAWASHEDLTPYQGWVIAYDATTLQQVGAFTDATTNGQAGIWMSGQGPSVDASGNLYVVTGNGAWDGVSNFSQSVLKLSPSLAQLDWFTPDNLQVTNPNDLDVGSSGLLLIPGTKYGVTGSKEGRFYVVDTTNLGHMVAGNTQIPQLFQAAPSGHHIHGSPVYWNGPGGPLAYVWPEQGFLKAFAFGTSTFNTTPLSQSTFAAPAGMPAGFLSLSSNGSAAGTGILWAALPLSQDANLQVAPGVLRAFDASDLTNQIWNSETNCSDQVGAFAKYVAPTVVNGKVYLVTFSNQLLVYGFLSSLPAANSGLIGSVRCDGSNVNLTTVGTADWAQWPNFNHKASGGAQISNYTVVGTGTVQTSTYARTMAWTDGTPTASGSTQSGVFVSGRGNGFQLSAPADTNTRTLYLYVSGNNSAGRLVAHLSDGSAPDYVNALSGVGGYDVVYTLTYNARSANQQLIVKWVQASDPGTVTLRAAALVDATSAPPLPPTNVSASDGTSPTSVTVSWTGSANATNYTVYRSTTSGSLGSSIGATNTTTLTDSTPVPGTQYYYSVVASGASGNSAPSAQASGHAGSLSGSVATSFAGLATGIANATSQTSTMTTTAAAIGGALGGSSTTSSATVNITAAGTSDWVKWPNSIRKATGNNQISTLVTAGTTAAQTYTNDQRSVAWSDGTPTASGSDQSGLYVSGLGTGFQITAPADTTTRTLSFYVGGSNSGGALIAHLSDGSAPDYVSTTAPVTGQYDIGYTITYRAASAGQRLSVSWTQASGSGNVRLQGAALK